MVCLSPNGSQLVNKFSFFLSFFLFWNVTKTYIFKITELIILKTGTIILNILSSLKNHVKLWTEINLNFAEMVSDRV